MSQVQQQNYNSALPPSSMLSGHPAARKNFKLNYNPENNKNNIFTRKLNGLVPETNNQFASNPLTKMLQPINITKSKRYARDKLNISDIPGAQSDVYKKLRNIEGREYIGAEDIEGARPAQLKQSKPMTGPDYKLYTKDINPDKWKSKRVVNPLKPEYEMPTKSGRMMRIGQIERSQPKLNISPQTKRFSNYIDDIEGTRSKKFNAITEEQRTQATNKSQDYSQRSYKSGTRNSNPFGIDPRPVQELDQQKLIQESQSHLGPTPNSHYARFQTYQNFQQTANFGNGFANSVEQLPQSNNNNNVQTLSYDNLAGPGIQNQSPQLSDYQLLAMQIPQNSRSMQMNVPNRLFNNSQPSILQNNQEAQINKTSLNDRVTSKRFNTFELLENKNANFTKPNGDSINPNYYSVNEYQNQSTDYVKPYINVPPNGYQSNTLEALPQANTFDSSPIIKNRVWSKARVVGQEMNDQQNRINSSGTLNANLSSSLVDKNINLKKNFNENLYQKGLLMNSGHKQLVSGFQQQAINPLNNEVNRSADVQLFNNKVPLSRDQRLTSKIQRMVNPLTQSTANYGGPTTSQQAYSRIEPSGAAINFQVTNSNNITKSLLPPTTSKTYGNFLDGKQIDQMISHLKQNSTNPIV